MRHRLLVRPLVALALATGLLPLAASPPVEAICPAPMAATPAGCCPETTPTSCPSCPREGRPSGPTAPARAATCCSLAALPPGESAQETRGPRSDGPTTSAPEAAAAAPSRSASVNRRMAVKGSSPPVQLLACTFRN